MTNFSNSLKKTNPKPMNASSVKRKSAQLQLSNADFAKSAFAGTMFWPRSMVVMSQREIKQDQTADKLINLLKKVPKKLNKKSNSNKKREKGREKMKNRKKSENILILQNYYATNFIR
jgi:hypothetical protein